MQLVGFDQHAKVAPTLDAHYFDVMEATLQRSVATFEVMFSRVILTKGSILLAGFPTTNVNYSRDLVRRACKNSSVPLFEPYKNDIVHMTLVRFASPLAPDVVKMVQKRLAAFVDQVLRNAKPISYNAM
jgi:hypothetical protein